MATYYGKKYKLLELRHSLKEVYMSLRIALKSGAWSRPCTTGQPLHIAMIDGEGYHGGMCDRFKGIVSLYAYCRHQGLPFRICYTYPFRLEDYLVPAAYDWTLRPREYTANPFFCRTLYMKGEHMARRLLWLRTRRQVHFYTNRDLLRPVNDAFPGHEALGWGRLFCELFRPASVLQARIDAIKREWGVGPTGGYVGVVFRFQNLLGDFPEYRFKAIADEAERETLVEQCLGSLKNMRARHADKFLLVTSDSVTFLHKAAQLDGVRIIPGTMVHMDGNKDANATPRGKYELYLKSFLDFYMLSEAEKIYRIGTRRMYPSEFPLYAAKVHDIPFESIVI